MGIIKSKFRKMEEFDCSMDDIQDKIEETSSDPRSPTSTITRTPLNEVRSVKNPIIRAANLANISTPINKDLMIIQDKRFKHLSQAFIDPRSPSEGIVRTPIVLKSTDISSIVNTPRILEEDLEREEDDFQETFVERLSRMSFDDLNEEKEEEIPVARVNKLPDLIETHFEGTAEPLTNPLVKALQSALDPRSPTIGIERSPLVFVEDNQKRTEGISMPVNKFNQQLLEGEQEEETEQAKSEEGEEKGQEKETKENPNEGVAEGEQKTERGQQQIPAIVEPEEDKLPSQQSDVFVDVGRVIYGTPVQISTTAQGPRTPLSCLANRKRSELRERTAVKSPLVAQSKGNKLQQLVNVNSDKKVKMAAPVATTNPFESTTPRKLIR